LVADPAREAAQIFARVCFAKTQGYTRGEEVRLEQIGRRRSGGCFCSVAFGLFFHPDALIVFNGSLLALAARGV
tara:strand:- start:53 stop:274 length:222 start_codon:yes stop_codon:yes gene_type:complete